MPDGTAVPGRPGAPPAPPAPPNAAIEAAVRTVLASLAGDLTAKEVALLAELEALGRMVKRAKAEIAALGVEDITASHIPTATDELDAVVAHTAGATNDILDCCETLERLEPRLAGEDAAALRDATTRIYEACSFQDITGQRIAKVVSALKAIEARVTAVVGTTTAAAPPAPSAEAPAPATLGEELANGPQLPGAGVSQAEIDKLLAAFD
jgi:chemotaxis protein CheZ